MSKIKNLIFEVEELFDDGYSATEICSRLNMPFDTVRQIERNYSEFVDVDSHFAESYEQASPKWFLD